MSDSNIFKIENRENLEFKTEKGDITICIFEIVSDEKIINNILTSHFFKKKLTSNLSKYIEDSIDHFNKKDKKTGIEKFKIEILDELNNCIDMKPSYEEMINEINSKQNLIDLYNTIIEKLENIRFLDKFYSTTYYDINKNEKNIDNISRIFKNQDNKLIKIDSIEDDDSLYELKNLIYDLLSFSCVFSKHFVQEYLFKLNKLANIYNENIRF